MQCVVCLRHVCCPSNHVRVRIDGRVPAQHMACNGEPWSGSSTAAGLPLWQRRALLGCGDRAALDRRTPWSRELLPWPEADIPRITYSSLVSRPGPGLEGLRVWAADVDRPMRADIGLVDTLCRNALERWLKDLGR